MTADTIRLEGVQREYDWEDITPTFAIIESITIFEYGNPNLTKEVLDRPLNDYIDTDGLERIVRNTVSVTVEFTVSTYNIRISGKTVSVSSADTK